jgi:hypothetical protein
MVACAALLGSRKKNRKVYEAQVNCFCFVNNFSLEHFFCKYLAYTVRDKSKKKFMTISDRRQGLKFSFGAHARMSKSSYSTEDKVVISKSSFRSNTQISTGAENVIRLTPPVWNVLRNIFLQYQCKILQHPVRHVLIFGNVRTVGINPI